MMMHQKHLVGVQQTCLQCLQFVNKITTLSPILGGVRYVAHMMCAHICTFRTSLIESDVLNGKVQMVPPVS